MELNAVQPITVSIADAVQLSGLSQATLYRLIDRDELATVKIGRRRLVRLDSLEQLFKA
jgi:excisionase family DNA binding protein